MYAEHPSIAKRWSSEFGSFKGQKQNFKPSPASESNESPQKGLTTLPRKPEVKRDFGPLHPGAKERLKTSHTASTKQSDEEDGVEAHTGSRPGKMKLKTNHVIDPLGKRDIRVAARKRV